MEGKTLADYGREMEQYRAAGMAGCKFKVGGLAPEEDFKRVEVARKAAGPDFKLVVDANRGWSAQDAIRFARLIEPLDIGWFEEPCHWYDDVAMMARVRQAIRIPVTAGQSEITSHASAGWWKRARWISSTMTCRKAAASPTGAAPPRSARSPACEMAHHEESQIALQLLAGVPHGTYVECFADPERDPGLADDVGEPTRDQGRHDAGVAGARLRDQARLGDGEALPGGLNGVIGDCGDWRRIFSVSCRDRSVHAPSACVALTRGEL